MNVRELHRLIGELLRLNPGMAETPILGSCGGDVTGYGIDGGGVAILEHFNPQVHTESRREYFESILTLAGFEVLGAYRLENGYWPESYVRLRAENPWWLFKTQHGLVEMGWRKRVISIGWDFVEAVPTDDDVTRNETLVHAYSPEKAIEYLRNVRRAAEGRMALGQTDDLKRAFLNRGYGIVTHEGSGVEIDGVPCNAAVRVFCANGDPFDVTAGGDSVEEAFASAALMAAQARERSKESGDE